MKKTVILLSAFFVIYGQSCVNDTYKEEVEYQLPRTFQSTNKIRYNVEGGGEINFIVENNQDFFLITILSYQFQSRNDSLMVSKADIDSLDVIVLEKMFRGTIDLGGIIYRNDLLTGSWTYLYIEYRNNWLRVANQAIINELSSLYFLVCNRIEKT